jgi:branched-chain amino acid transport system ATP-binding protein
MNEAILEIDSIKVRYSGLPVIHGVSLHVNQGETVSVLGANGAGKSTLLKAVMGTQQAFEGTLLKAVMGTQQAFEGKIRFRSQEIQNLRTEEIVRMGIVCVPEEKMLFSPLSVEENLYMGAYVLNDQVQIQKNLNFVYNLFPILENRKDQPASTLSGGEQQMVAIGRGLMSQPHILMLDEPSLGLAPLLVDEVLDTVRKLKAEGLTILLVEQNVREALDLSDRGYVLQTGRIVGEGSGEELLESDMFREAFLGI